MEYFFKIISGNEAVTIPSGSYHWSVYNAGDTDVLFSFPAAKQKVSNTGAVTDVNGVIPSGVAENSYNRLGGWDEVLVNANGSGRVIIKAYY